MNVKYNVPFSIMEKTKIFLINKGKENKEAYVLWVGKKDYTGSYTATRMIIPEQIATRTPYGYSFDIPGNAISKVVQDLYNYNEIGLIQVHSHPSASARHSERDDNLSILNRLGALSIVLPYFGNVNFNDFSNSFVHIHTGVHKWDVVPNRIVNKIINIMR